MITFDNHINKYYGRYAEKNIATGDRQKMKKSEVNIASGKVHLNGLKQARNLEYHRNRCLDTKGVLFHSAIFNI